MSATPPRQAIPYHAVEPRHKRIREKREAKDGVALVEVGERDVDARAGSALVGTALGALGATPRALSPALPLGRGHAELCARFSRPAVDGTTLLRSMRAPAVFPASCESGAPGTVEPTAADGRSSQQPWPRPASPATTPEMVLGSRSSFQCRSLVFSKKFRSPLDKTHGAAAAGRRPR